MITHLDLAEPVLSRRVSARAGWIFELKYDGIRMLAAHRDGAVELVSRRGTDFADRFPEVTAELLDLPELVLDGELVVMDSKGHPQFDRLSRRSRLKRPIEIERGARTDPACFFAFDVLEIAGEDLRSRPLTERKAILYDAITSAKRIRYVDHAEDGLWLFGAAEEAGLEGIVAKKATSPYRKGRTGDWIKVETTAGRAIVEQRRDWNS